MFTLITRTLRMFFSMGNLKKSQANGIVRLWITFCGHQVPLLALIGNLALLVKQSRRQFSM